MKKFVCTVCGYVYEGESAPEFCPVCKAPAEKFKEQTGDKTWAAEHVVGVAQGAPEDIIADLRASFEGECTLQWQELHIEKDIRKSDFTGRKQLLKRLNMQQNLQNCLVKL